jgi:Fe-S cluster biogenesis protein NfuA
MPSPVEDKEFRQRMQRLETLIHQVEGFADPAARAHAREIVQALMDLHAAALEQTLNHIVEGTASGTALIDLLGQDPLVGGLLLLYGLHPLDLDTRVRQALDKVRPMLHHHSAEVELLSVRDGTAHLRLRASGHGCHSSAQALKAAIEEAICEKAPDVTSVHVEEALTGGSQLKDGPARIALPLLRG